MDSLKDSFRDVLQIGKTYPYNVLIGAVVAGTTFYAIKKYFGGGVCHSKAQLTGKTVIITGSNTGIGLETAVDMAKRGARVILACRNKEKGEAAVVKVKQRTSNNNAFFVRLDLNSLESVREFAAKILEEEPRIDILINNAGVMIPPYTKTEDGFELQFGVNHLAHFLLTNLLLDRIKESPSARIVNVSSLGHVWGKINFDDLQWETKYNKYGAYFQSKLANVLFTRSLAQRLRGTSVTTYSVHPGSVRTELGRHMQIMVFLCMPFLWIVSKSPWQGAQTSIHCAVSEGIERDSGKYFADCKVKKSPNPLATDDEVAERLWQVSAQLVGLEG